MHTFLRICKKIKSGKKDGWVNGYFGKRTVSYAIASQLKAYKIGVTIY